MTISLVQGLQSKRAAIGSSATLVPPFPSGDASLLYDISVPVDPTTGATISAANSWTSLPAGLSYTSAAGSSVSAAGYIPGTGNNLAGRIGGSNLSSGSLGNQGTVYCRVQRAAISVDTSASSVSTWYEGNGNVAAANPGSYPPTLFYLSNSGQTAYFAFQLIPGGVRINITNGTQFIPATGGSVQTMLNPRWTAFSPNVDPNYCDIVFTWFGTIAQLYVDGLLIVNATLASAFPSGDTHNGVFNNIGIGNKFDGQNATLGGNLGSFAITRFQVSTAYCIPPTSGPLIGLYGDSYVSGGGAGGDAGAQGTASTGTPNVGAGGASAILSNTTNTKLTVGTFVTGNGFLGIWTWVDILQSYAYRNLGIYLPMVAAAKSGYSSNFTGGYGNPIDSSPVAIVFTGAPTSTSGTLTAVWPYTTGTAYQIKFSDGQVHTATLTFNSTAVTWTGAITGTPTVNATVPFATYSDALNNAQPEIMVAIDSVNNLYECPTTDGSATNCVSDWTWRFNYWANGNPKLRAIILLENLSLELTPALGLTSTGITFTGAPGSGGATLNANWSGTTGQRIIVFSDGEFKLSQLTNGSTAVTWVGGFTGSPTTSATIQGAGGSLTNAQCKTVAQLFKLQMRNAFLYTPFLAGTRKVPVYYIPSYETWAGASDGPYRLIGSNPQNVETQGANQGPNGSAPNIHPCASGHMKIADDIWPTLFQVLQQRAVR